MTKFESDRWVRSAPSLRRKRAHRLDGFPVNSVATMLLALPLALVVTLHSGHALADEAAHGATPSPKGASVEILSPADVQG